MSNKQIRLIEGDVLASLKHLESDSINVIQESPDYWFQVDYGVAGQDGLEPTLRQYLSKKRQIAKELYRVLVNGGICTLVMGDTQNNLSPVYGKGKLRSGDWEYRRPLQDGYLEGECLTVPIRLIDVFKSVGFAFMGYKFWKKQTGSKQTKLGQNDTEFILFFVKQEKSRRLYPNHLTPFKSDIISVPTSSKKSSHRCAYPYDLAYKLLSHTVKPGYTLLCPWCGSGTTLEAGLELGCNVIGIDLDTSLAQQRIKSYLERPKQLDLIASNLHTALQIS